MFFSRHKEPQNLGYVEDVSFEQDERRLIWEPEVFGGELPKDFLLASDGWTLNQGQSTSCTSHGLVHSVATITGKRLSPRYSFSKIKTDSEYNSSRIGWGAYTVDNMRLLQKEGICDFDLAPNDKRGNDDEYINLTITDEMKQSAHKNRGGVYVSVSPQAGSDLDRFDKMKEYLAIEKRPFLLGMMWHKEYNHKDNPTGIIPLKPVQSQGSGHIVSCIGYAHYNNHEYLVCENSFGADWGHKGEVWLPKGFVDLRASLAFIPDQRAKDLGYVIPTAPVAPKERSKRREQLVWQDFAQIVIERWFPLNVEEGARMANKAGRAMMEREKLKIIFALAYLGWVPDDLRHHYYARSRSREDAKAYHFDLYMKKKDFYAKET